MLHPLWWVGCSLLQPEPLFSWKGFHSGQREPYPRKMLVSLGPRLHASPMHTGSWVRYCLGWQKAQETMRGWQTFVPVIRVGMFVYTHDRGWQMEQQSRVCGQGGRCQGTFSPRTQSVGFHFPSTLGNTLHSHQFTNLPHSKPRHGQASGVNGSGGLDSPTVVTLLSNLRTVVLGHCSPRRGRG